MNNKLCECCLGEFDINELKSMTASYTYKDTNEIFSKIINQCFNLKVSYE